MNVMSHHLLQGKVPDMPPSELPVGGGGGQQGGLHQSMLLPTVPNTQSSLDTSTGWQQVRPGLVPMSTNPAENIFGMHISQFGGRSVAQIEGMEAGVGNTGAGGGGGKLPLPSTAPLEVFPMQQQQHHVGPVERNNMFGIQLGPAQMESLESSNTVGNIPAGAKLPPPLPPQPSVAGVNAMPPLEVFHHHHQHMDGNSLNSGPGSGAHGGGTMVTPSTSYIMMAHGVFSCAGGDKIGANPSTFTSAGRGGASGTVVPIGTERAQKATLSSFPLSSGFMPSSKVWSYKGQGTNKHEIFY